MFYLVRSYFILNSKRTFLTSRRYLQVEWEVRKGSARAFTSESISRSLCRVPLQDNSSDCGLYLLQYAESFLQVLQSGFRAEFWLCPGTSCTMVHFVPGQSFLVSSMVNVRNVSHPSDLTYRGLPFSGIFSNFSKKLGSQELKLHLFVLQP